jgi:hypothetical protein
METNQRAPVNCRKNGVGVKVEEVELVRDPRAIFLAYRDLEHERFGRSYCKWLMKRAGLSDKGRFLEWKFETLAVTCLKELVVEDAAIADITVIATRAGEALPVELKEVIAGWAGRGDREPRLCVVLLSGNSTVEGESYPDYEFFARQARRTGNQVVFYLRETALERDWEFNVVLTSRKVAGKISLSANAPRKGTMEESSEAIRDAMQLLR